MSAKYKNQSHPWTKFTLTDLCLARLLTLPATKAKKQKSQRLWKALSSICPPQPHPPHTHTKIANIEYLEHLWSNTRWEWQLSPINVWVCKILKGVLLCEITSFQSQESERTQYVQSIEDVRWTAAFIPLPPLTQNSIIFQLLAAKEPGFCH